MNRLQEKYQETILPTLVSSFELPNKMAAPKLAKIVVNIGIKEGASDKVAMDKTAAWLSAITGQLPSRRKAKKSIATFKIREGDTIGLTVTLRKKKMYEFLDKLISIVLPRVRDFRGVSPKSFDGRGNYTLGFSEQIVFPEIDYSKIDKVRGLEVTIVTSTKDDKMAYKLLELLGMPFKKVN
jgi:large subunit ribosomal protein L5